MTNPEPLTNPEPSPGRRSSAPGTPGTPLEWLVGTAAFAVEVALAVTVAVAGYRAADGGVLGWLAAAVAVVALFAVWGRWMAPRAGHRLPLRGRLILGSVLVLLAAAGIVLTGSWLWGVILAVVGIAVILIGQPMLDS